MIETVRIRAKIDKIKNTFLIKRIGVVKWLVSLQTLLKTFQGIENT